GRIIILSIVIPRREAPGLPTLNRDLSAGRGGVRGRNRLRPGQGRRRRGWPTAYVEDSRLRVTYLASHRHQDLGASGLLGGSGVPGCTFYSRKPESSRLMMLGSTPGSDVPPGESKAAPALMAVRASR